MDEVVCMGGTRLEPPSSLWMKWFVWGNTPRATIFSMDEVVCMGGNTPRATIFSMDEVVCMGGGTRLEPPSSLWMKWFVWGEHA